MRTKKVKQRKWMAFALAGILLCTGLTGCGAKDTENETKVVQETLAETEENKTEEITETITVRVGSLKGPTSMGLLFLKEWAKQGESKQNYEFQMATGADELLPLMVKGDLDIALIPANVASILYQKTEGGISVIDINTLGVLYMVSGNEEIQSMRDLAGKTIYLTGQGTTPDYILRYLLTENGLDPDKDCTLEYKSEATEVAAVLAENSDAVGLLPQPFVTAACAQNEALRVALDMTAEWKQVQGEEGSSLVTGVTVVRKSFAQEHPEAVATFLKEHEESTAAINADPATGATYAVQEEIVAKEPIAQKAIPECNITCITGEEMKQALSGYLKVLFEASKEAVGGALPGDDFYYTDSDR